MISNMDQGGAYAVLDISDPEDPALLTQIEDLPRIYAIIVGGNHRIYAAGRDGDFLTHSFVDPTNIALVKSAPIGQDQLYAAAQDHFVFLGRQNNVVKVDVSDEQNPMVVGEGSLGRPNPDHGQVTPMGNLIFIGNDHGTGSALFCHQYGPDTTPLAVQSVYPSDGSTGVNPKGRVSLVFSDYVDTDTIEGNVMIRPIDGEPLDGIFTYAFNTLSFAPSADFETETTYEVALSAGGIRDVVGNGLVDEVLVRFSTGDAVVVPPPEAPPPATGGTPGMASGGGSSEDPGVGSGRAPEGSGSGSGSGHGGWTFGAAGVAGTGGLGLTLVMLGLFVRRRSGHRS